jgi:hypothetical protein
MVWLALEGIKPFILQKSGVPVAHENPIEQIKKKTPLTKEPLFHCSSGTGTEIGIFSTLFTLIRNTVMDQYFGKQYRRRPRKGAVAQGPKAE